MVAIVCHLLWLWHAGATALVHPLAPLHMSYCELREIKKANFVLGGDKQFIPASDHAITAGVQGPI